MQSPPFPLYLVPPGSKYSPNTIFSNTLSFLSSRNVSDQVYVESSRYALRCIYHNGMYGLREVRNVAMLAIVEAIFL